MHRFKWAAYGKSYRKHVSANIPLRFQKKMFIIIKLKQNQQVLYKSQQFRFNLLNCNYTKWRGTLEVTQFSVSTNFETASVIWSNALWIMLGRTTPGMSMYEEQRWIISMPTLLYYLITSLGHDPQDSGNLGWQLAEGLFLVWHSQDLVC